MFIRDYCRRLFVTSIGAVYDAIQAAFIVLRIMGYVCASVQLETQSPENTNMITDELTLTCTTFCFIFKFYCFHI